MIKGDPREEGWEGTKEREVSKERRKCLEKSEQSTVPSVAERPGQMRTEN